MTETSAQSENRLIAERREKLGRLREKGSAFPNDFRRDSIAAELHAAYGEHEAESLEAESHMVRVAGRMMAKRPEARLQTMQETCWFLAIVCSTTKAHQRAILE